MDQFVEQVIPGIPEIGNGRLPAILVQIERRLFLVARVS